jgi:pSer/pThr/pTyr-binding forkhead associated (FHA) protein
MDSFGPHARSPAELAATRRLRGSGTPFLELRDETGRQRLVPLDGARLSIGRAEGCGVALPWDPEVSRLHAVVERIDGVWVIEDAGSRNGTAVDGESVTGRRLLHDGDVICAGRTSVLFQCTAPGDAARTEAAVDVPVPELTTAQRRVLETLPSTSRARGSHTSGPSSRGAPRRRGWCAGAPPWPERRRCVTQGAAARATRRGRARRRPGRGRGGARGADGGAGAGAGRAGARGGHRR